MGVKTIASLLIVIFNTMAISCSNEETNSENQVTETAVEENNEIAEDTPNEPTQSTTLKILPLGDSRVEGDRPEDESYRFELWKLLIDSELNFDFVGTRMDNAMYPLYKGNQFDTDHEGTGGATSTQLLLEIDRILDEVEIDVVLLGIGGNDLDQGSTIDNIVSNISTIIDRLQSKNKHVTILLEQIAPAISSYMTEERKATLVQFNNEISNISSEQRTENSIILPVNMSENWKDEYLADDVHYNELGAKVVAERYFYVLDSLQQR